MKNKFLFLILSAVFFFKATAALAVCPVCTIAVGAGVGLAQWLGIDDTISGVWIGGLTVSMIMWTINWLKKKNWVFKGYKMVIWLAYYLLIVAPLYFTGLIGHPYNKIWGMDKIVLGVVLGSLGFVGSVNLYEFLKKKNHNRAHFPFEKIVITLLILFILSFIFYFLTR